MDYIASNARYFNNIPILSKKYRSVVHLEDQEDQAFWNTLLQRVRPGNYFFVPYSKSERGFNTTGCDQCLKYKPYLSHHFFICIDSDLRYLMREIDLDAAHFVIQTYTYSWENHLIEATTLQNAILASGVECDFFFSTFLNNLSKALFEPLLLLLYCKRKNNNYLSEKDFRHILKKQCSATEINNNGQGYVDSISRQFQPYLDSADSIGFNLEKEAALFYPLGLNPNNAYLHSRGHNIFELILYIGRFLFRKKRLRFEEEIIKRIKLGGSYWEYSRIENDLASI